MIAVADCLMCGSTRLRTLMTHTFAYPAFEERDESGGMISEKTERLMILFEEIYTESDSIEFRIEYCRSCGMLFLNPRFTEEELKIKYEAVERLGYDQKRHQDKPPVNADARANRIFKLLTDLSPDTFGSCRVLDYGGAEGYNLVPFIADNDCFLMDYVVYKLPAGVTFLGEDLACISPDDTFDIILLSHVLEHVSDPQGLVKALASRLSEVGMLYAEVPLGCWKEWEYLSEPLTHINYFSAESMFKCFTRAGLSVVHLSTEYQLVRDRKAWCVDIVGTRADAGQAMLRPYYRTSIQMRNPFYGLPTFYRKVKSRITRPR